MAIILSILIPTLLGLLLLGILLRHDAETSPLLMRIGMSFPIGMGLITLQTFFLGLLRVPLALPYVALPPIAEIALLSFAVWRAKIRLLPALPPPRAAANSWPVTVLMWALSVWAVFKLGSVFVETTLRPIYAWDAWANWSAGAKAFYYSRSLLLDAPPQDFFGKGVVTRIVEYPLHNSLSQLWFALWSGGFDDIWVKMGSPVALLSVAAVFYSVGKKEIGKLFALPLLVILLSSPLLSYHAVEAYSDILLSMYIFLALTAFFISMRGQRSYWLLAGFFSALALFTKDEAPFFVLPLLLSAVFYILKSNAPSQERRSALAGLFLPLLLAAPWFLFKLYYKIGIGAGIKVVLTFHPEVIGTVLTELLALNNFFVVPLFFVVFAIAAGRPTREFVHLFVPLACFEGFFIALYCLTTFYYEFFSNGTVFFRNVLTWYPSLCLLVIVLLKRLLPDDWRSAPAGATSRR